MADPNSSQEFASHIIGEVNPDQSIGQSFVSLRPRLNGITLWLTGNDTPGSLTVKLFISPEDTNPIFVTPLSTGSIGDNSPVDIPITVQSYPAGQSYFIQLTTLDTSVQINGRNEDAYPEGEAYVNNQPINADLAFRLSYDYDIAAFLSDISGWTANISFFILLFILLFVPGWLLLRLSGIYRYFPLSDQIPLAIGLSIAIIPVVILWTTTVGFHWEYTNVKFLFGLLSAVALVTVLAPIIIPKLRSIDHEKRRLKIDWILIGLLVIFVATLFQRLIMVRDLATPAWVDSVHHGMITRLILENGGYPSSYAPYMEINPYNYHPGFHSLLATYIWLSGMNIADAMLILGQVLNAVIVLEVYLLAVTLTKDRVSGVFAALITGFLTPMPAYLTSWGRYTQLTGSIILPVILALVRLIVDRVPGKTPTTRWNILIYLGIASGGLFLIHYRVAAFAGCLILVYYLIHVVINRRSICEFFHATVKPLLIAGIAMIILVIPWLAPAIASVFIPKLAPSASAATPPLFFSDFSWRFLTAAYGKQSLALAGLGMLIGLIRRKSYVITLALWVGMMVFLANLDALDLPGGGFVNNTSVEITLFLPISVMGGYFLSKLNSAWQFLLPFNRQRLLNGLTVLICGWVIYSGSLQLTPIINPITILSRTQDRPALEWVEQNIPKNEEVLINPFSWGYGIYAGNDGGYWITPLAGQKTLPPPVLYGLGDVASVQSVVKIIEDIMNQGENPVALRQILDENNIHYIFLGRRGGVLSPQALQASSLFKVIYEHDGVMIFQTTP